MAGYTTKALDASTWDAFAELIERHNGVWGGCWCIGFHAEGGVRGSDHRGQKELRVRNGEAHAALVFDGDRCVGWCQFGSPEELPRIKYGKAYRDGVERDAHGEPVEPDWRITCFFVDKEHRKQGVAAVALHGALREIARLGGGVVESMPEDTEGRKTSGSFLFNASLSIFEREGFTRTRELGKHAWLVTKRVRQAPARRGRAVQA
jgi:GNAT superfamily N-acetyltransferase